jgi:hypothetical protein
MIVSPRLLRPGRRRFFRRFVFLDALAGLLFVAPSAGGVLGDSTPPAVAPRGRRVLSAWPARPVSNCGERGSTRRCPASAATRRATRAAQTASGSSTTGRLPRSSA